MEQSAEREDSRMILLKLPWEDVVCGIDQARESCKHVSGKAVRLNKENSRFRQRGR